MPESFRIESLVGDHGHLIVRISGILHMTNAGALRVVLDRIVDEKIPVVILLGADLLEISSSAIGFLVGARMKMDQYGGKIFLVGFKDRITQILNMTGVDVYLPVYSSEEAVLANLEENS